MPGIRRATHAGSWYSDSPKVLSKQLEEWLSNVPDEIDGKSIPCPGARIIIAPHAGYAYSGPTAAWAYKAIDSSQVKRVFLLGPSHHFYLTECALSKFTTYATPLGDIPLDLEVIGELDKLNAFDTMRSGVDEEEHSLELHLPYIRKTLPNTKLVPILVGNTSPATEVEFGELLAPYLSDPENAFVISSDFAHWGSRFSYTSYTSNLLSIDNIRSLRHSDRNVDNPKIYESIEAIDKDAMRAIGTGKHEEFLASLRKTGNTVCGRHPIGIIMAAIEHAVANGQIKDTKFQFVQYARSSDVVRVSDSSVSYVSAYAIIDSK